MNATTTTTARYQAHIDAHSFAIFMQERLEDANWERMADETCECCGKDTDRVIERTIVFVDYDSAGEYEEEIDYLLCEDCKLLSNDKVREGAMATVRARDFKTYQKRQAVYDRLDKARREQPNVNWAHINDYLRARGYQVFEEAR